MKCETRFGLKMKSSSVARDISYANSAKTRAGRVLVRSCENMTGRMRLLKRVSGYETEIAQGADFWQVMFDRYRVELDFLSGDLTNIPETGPVVVIANHPFGILDGLVLGYALSKVRPDFKIVAMNVFRKAKDLNDVILPVNFDETRDAMKQNMKTRNDAITYLKQGGCVGIFPGGTVSTAAKPMGQPMDPRWRNFTAKMVQKSGAEVVPIYFSGANSRLFQLASHTHYTLRMSLLIREFKKKLKKPVKMAVGQPIQPEQLLDFHGRPNEMMDFLRQQTYELALNPLPSMDYGYEFEEQYRN